MIEIKTLKQLIELMKENDLSELDLRDKDEQVTLKRGPEGGVQFAMPPAVMPAPVAPAAPAPATDAPAGEPAGEPTAKELGLIEIVSPMVGTFYASASPDVDAYVQVGAQIGPDSIVCIVEAMKVFNEIKAEVSGAIHKVMVTSGDAVEFGQPLFQVKPG